MRIPSSAHTRQRHGAALALAVLAGCASTPTVEYVLPELAEIELPGGAIEILPGTGVYDSPVLSPDGRRLAVQVLVYEDPVLPFEIYSLAVAEQDEEGRWGRAEIIRKGIYRKYLGRMAMPIQPAFDETGEQLVLTQIEFDSGLSIPWVHTLRSWIERIPWRGGEPVRLVERRGWGLRPNELIQHGRISPDGHWLTFYTRVHPATQGIYLLDMKTGEHYQLSNQHDKHPTWDPTGRRIYFHYAQGGKRHRFDFFGRGIERSVLGYIELTIEDGKLTDWRRVLMDEVGDAFIYHKHPTEVAGTSLLFFHGRRKPDGDMKLMVRLAEPGSPVYVVKPEYEGGKLEEAKHPCSSFERADLIFIGKPKGGEDYDLLLSLTDVALAKIDRVLHNEKQPELTP